jgi:hypothetical protein
LRRKKYENPRNNAPASAARRTKTKKPEGMPISSIPFTT